MRMDEENRMKAPHKPSKLVELHVRDTLDWDPLLNDRRIEVVAEGGHVKLAGSVPTYYEKLRASDDAWTVRGVKAVDNELLVGPVGGVINDLDVAAACNDALDRDRFVPKDSVTPTVRAGRVQLRGQVRNHFERQAAELALSRVDGVLGIENLIAISNEPIPSDIADRINKAFERSAIIDDSRITVTNDGHEVFLTGSVGSYAAMREALDTAWAAPGVHAVESRLVIEP